jgi:hypothetical protein
MTARHIPHHRAVPGTAAHLRPKFYVVTALINSQRFRARYELYNDFVQHMADSGATLYTIECAFGGRAFAATDATNPHHIQVRTAHELWHKEALLNRAIEQLPADWEYVAWIDADVAFTRPDWVNETLQQLQHYAVVQLFSEALDLGPQYEVLARHEAFVRSYALQRPRRALHEPYQPKGGGSGSATPTVNYWHPGFAWAARRAALDQVGQLVDTAVLGAADNHMAHALIGEVDRSVHPDATPGYRAELARWQLRAERHVRRNVGYVDGTLLHHWHGKKVDRRYWDRWRILVDHQFDPVTDLKRDTQGLWQLVDDGTPRTAALRDGLRAYFRQRNEDSIDV